MLHQGPPSELAKATGATWEQPETSPGPGPSDLKGPVQPWWVMVRDKLYRSEINSDNR